MLLKYFFYTGLLIASWPAFSDTSNQNIITETCRLVISPQYLNYGVLSRANLTKLNTGEGVLPAQQIVVQQFCLNKIAPEMAIQDKLRTHSSYFQYGKNGSIDIRLVDFLVDGQSVLTAVTRNQFQLTTESLQPGDIIRPKEKITGKVTEIILTVTPKIGLLSLTAPEAKLDAGQVTVLFPNQKELNIDITSELQPIACAPSISDNGTVNYHQIPISNLSKQGITILPTRTLSLVISCNANANVAVRARSNRPNTISNVENENHMGRSLGNAELVASGLGKNMPFGLPDVKQPIVAGLGLSKNKKIGGYMLNLPMTQIHLDGKKVNVIYLSNTLPNNSVQWAKETYLPSHGGSLFLGSAPYISFGTDIQANTPTPFMTLDATLVIQAYITDKRNLNLSEPVILDGSSTLELYYY